VPSSENFGNYMLKGIAEIPPLNAVPWDFSAPGWPYLFSFIIFCCSLVLFRLWRRWQANAYRRTALRTLRELSPDEALKLLPALLKSTAMTTFGRESVAALYGDDWLAFLEATLPQPTSLRLFRSGEKKGFNGSLGRFFVALSYQKFHSLTVSPREAEQLLSLARRWINSHQRPVL
jgi:hypothetical protein